VSPAEPGRIQETLEVSVDLRGRLLVGVVPDAGKFHESPARCVATAALDRILQDVGVLAAV
jgi:hypothetical protein